MLVPFHSKQDENIIKIGNQKNVTGHKDCLITSCSFFDNWHAYTHIHTQ